MKVAIYCRLSEEDRNKTNKDDDSNSIVNQKAMLQQYALEHMWDLYDIYSDDDYTGADRNRPEFTRLLADAAEHKFDIILCKTQSRFTRELELVEKYIHGLFPIWGIRFVSIVDNADTANKGNKKSRQINGLVNEWYLEDMSDNIRSVLTSRRENGFHIGSFAPYGYQKDPNLKGHLIIDQEAAQVVKEIFSMFADGYGKTFIARQLNDRGIANPSEYKRQKGFHYGQPKDKIGRLWSYSSIRDVLTNEVYIGNLVQGKSESVSYKTKQICPRPRSKWIRVIGTHDAIIDRRLWDCVQGRISEHYRPFSSTGMIYPLSGKVRCMHCGASLSIHKTHGHQYLQCHTRHVSRDTCSGAFIPLKELEEIVLKEIRTLSKELLEWNELAQRIEYNTNLLVKKEKIQAEEKSYMHKMEELSATLKHLYVDQLTGLITDQDYTEMKGHFQAERENMDILLAACRSRLEEIQARIAIRNNPREIIAQYTSPGNLSRGMTEALIDHIAVGKRNSESRKVPVIIFWNF